MALRACAPLVLGVSLGWLGACQTEAPPPPAPAPAAEQTRSVPPIAWASAPDCRAKLGLLEQAARADRLAVGEQLPFVVVLPGQAGVDDWLAPPSVTIAADLPLAVRQRSELARLDVPCVLMVDQPRDQRVEHRLSGRDTVRSFYQSGLRTERNPDYDLAQLRVRQAEREAKDDGFEVFGVGDPMLDLVGALVNSVVSGFNQGKEERELDEALVELTSTPRSLDRPIYRAYEFEQTTVLAGKEATIPIALLERPSGRVWRAELRQRERREFAIIDGLDPRDRDYEARRAASLTEQEFERWQREPPRLQLSALAAALRDTDAPAPAQMAVASRTTVVAIPDRRAELAQDLLAQDLDAAVALPAHAANRPQNAALATTLTDVALPAAQPAARGDPRAAAVVAIVADQRSGGGVYVRADLVLTTAALVERASVVDVVALDGARVLGLVARTDPGRNLALVQVSRPGTPVALHDGPPVTPGRAIEGLLGGAAGPPILVSGRYLGAGAAPATPGSALTDLVYVDAPAAGADQPEATPWFLGDSLIALGTGASAGEPLGAIGSGEILDFLYGSGGALAALR